MYTTFKIYLLENKNKFEFNLSTLVILFAIN